jgi:hypothetical protein
MEDSRRYEIKNNFEINNQKRIIFKGTNDQECLMEQELKKEKETNIKKTIELVNLQEKLKEQNNLLHEAKIELQSLKQQQFKINSNEIVSLKHQLKKLEEKNLFLNSLLDKKNLECEEILKDTKEKYDAQLKKGNIFAAKQCEAIKKHKQALFDEELIKIKESHSNQMISLRSMHAEEINNINKLHYNRLEEMKNSQNAYIDQIEQFKTEIDSKMELITNQNEKINELNKKIASYESQQHEISLSHYSISTLELNLKIKKFESKFQNINEMIEIKEFQAIINDLNEELKSMANQQHTHLKKIEDQEKSLQNDNVLINKQKETISSLEYEIKNLNSKTHALVQEKIQTQLKNYSLNEKIENLEKTCDEYKQKLENEQPNICELKESELSKFKQIMIKHCMTLDLTIELESNENKILNDAEFKEESLVFETKLNDKISSIQNKDDFLINIDNYFSMQLDNLKFLIFNLKTGLNQVKIDRDSLDDKIKKDSFKYNSKIKMLTDEISALQQNKAPRLSKEYDKLSKMLKDEVEKCKQKEIEMLNLKKIINSEEIENDKIKNALFKQNQTLINLMKSYNIKYKKEDFDLNLREIREYIESLWYNIRKYENKYTSEIKRLNELSVKIDIESQEKDYIIDKLKEQIQQENGNKRKVYRDENDNNDRKKFFT